MDIYGLSIKNLSIVSKENFLEGKPYRASMTRPMLKRAKKAEASH